MEDLRISSSVDRATVDRFDKCIFQPTGCGWVLSDFEGVLKPNDGVLEFGHGVLPQKRLIKRVDGSRSFARTMRRFQDSGYQALPANSPTNRELDDPYRLREASLRYGLTRERPVRTFVTQGRAGDSAGLAEQARAVVKGEYRRILRRNSGC